MAAEVKLKFSGYGPIGDMVEPVPPLQMGAVTIEERREILAKELEAVTEPLKICGGLSSVEGHKRLQQMAEKTNTVLEQIIKHSTLHEQTRELLSEIQREEFSEQ